MLDSFPAASVLLFQPVDAGFYSTPLSVSAIKRSGQQRCKVGHICSGGLITACPVGEYAGAEMASNASACEQCERGDYADETSSSSCKACSPGMFSDGRGQSECKNCVKGKFQGLLVVGAPWAI